MTTNEILDFVALASTGDGVSVELEPLIRRVALAAIEFEREACIRTCQDVMRSRSEPSDAGMCIAAIRSRV